MTAYDDDFLITQWLNLSPQSRTKVLKQEPETVWLFGAGASHDYNLNPFGVPVPLAGGFFEAFNKLPTSQGFAAHVGPLINYLAHSRGIPPDQVGGWDENIEAFMTSVESELETLKAARQEGDKSNFEQGFLAASAYNNMHFIFASVINEAQNGAPTSLYDQALHFASPKDTFLTFNWDTLLDRALANTGGWHPNDGYGVNFTASMDTEWKGLVGSATQFRTGWKLLKLHGSTNWLIPYTGIHFETLESQSLVPKQKGLFLFWQSSLPFATHSNRWRGGYAPTCYGYYPPNLPIEYFSPESISAPAGKKFLRIAQRVFSPYEEGSGEGIPASPLLITPVRQKRYDAYQHAISEVWTQAIEALGTAKRLVVIGYSFPETDVRPLDLVRGLLQTRGADIGIEIVSPGVQAILDRIGGEHLAKAKRLRSLDGTFSDFLVERAQRVPELMMSAAEQDGELESWLNRLHAMSRAPFRARRN